MSGTRTEPLHLHCFKIGCKLPWKQRPSMSKINWPRSVYQYSHMANEALWFNLNIILFRKLPYDL